MNIREAIEDVFENYNVSSHTEEDIKNDLVGVIQDSIKESIAQIEWENETGRGEDFTVEDVLERLKSEIS